MKQREKTFLLIGLACLCWGLLFPQYVFSRDTYQLLYQTGMEVPEDADYEELEKAIQEGHVVYSFKLLEYLKKMF